MGRPTRDDRRRDYLDIGASIVADAGTATGDEVGLALAHVRLAEVAERAGVTKGALYHIWPSQEAFWADLLEHLMSEQRLAGIERVKEVVAEVEAFPDGQPLDLPGYLNAVFDCFRDDPSFFTRISLYAYLNDEPTRAALDRQFRESLSDAREFVERGIGLMGRRMRPGSSVDDLMIAAIALLEGLCLEYRVDPDGIPDLEIDGRRWTMYAVGADALVRGYTEPIDVRSPEETGGDS